MAAMPVEEDPQLTLLTEIFRPYLVENLRFSTIVCQLTAFFDQHGSAGIVNIVVKEQQEGPEAAMEAFLDWIAEKAIPGSYSAVINALKHMEDEKVKHIADWIEGVDPMENMEHKKQIIHTFAPVLKNIPTSQLVRHLTCLGRQDKELLQAHCENKGDCYAAITLMFLITTKAPEWFTELVKALRIINWLELADLLDPPEDHSSLTAFNIPGDVPPAEGCFKACPPQEPDEIIEIELRDYQKELSQHAVQGKNTVVVAPAGSGKTVVGVYIAKMHLANGMIASNNKPKKIAFLVNKVPLVKQQQDQFKKYMSTSKVIGVSGETGSTMMEIKSLLKDRDVIVMTAQILVNALDNTDSNKQRLDISDFSMIIMDECHRCQESSLAPRPQIIGLTAGLGVGQAQSSYKAESHILMLCANMDVEKISIVEENVEELNRHVNIPTEETILVARKQDDKFAEGVNLIMENIERIIAESEGGKRLAELDRKDLQCPNTRGTQPYEQWVVKMKNASATILTDNDMRRVIVACSNHLREYTNALYINHAVRPKDGLTYLQNFFDNERDKQDSFNDTEAQLFRFFTEREEELKQIVEDPENRNPLLDKLGSTMRSAYDMKPDSCGILFTKTRSSTEALKAWIKETPELKHLNPGILIGGGGSGGMTQTQQVDLLQMFKENKHKLIIATSVAEEGIDIQACNLVFRYNYFSNTIGRIQARGRNRAAHGRFFLIASVDSGLGNQEEMNKIRESMMNTATKAIKGMPKEDFLKQIDDYQRRDRAERRMKEKGKVSKQKEHSGIEVELICLQCGNVACRNTDIRRIKSAHHAVFGDFMAERYKTVPNPKKSKRINDLEFLEKVHCANCSQEWGCMLKYCGHLAPVLKISFFAVKYNSGKQVKYKKWSDVPFHVQEFSIEDIEKEINKENVNKLDEDVDQLSLEKA
ncbi:probable ATP-dependent RNA helicase DDX58 [Anneissia japonica]|uniref:probable ATP-dependent RNA helicase DDX58 n=1 Tax=Anneissia japonica TaxID=1529436 RepID=UPI00142566D4|nr:probable ATP-dependent RNA helicase DDX58 [Anneissia japonica]